ncbi:MAG TPA: DUF4097 family beta strand repeat-containing protein [Gemmatimonadaceae bacterium]|nr:DUF4097 family beta strand repeat-containing protein [Gemmatimonadaceae bacterium]
MRSTYFASSLLLALLLPSAVPAQNDDRVERWLDNCRRGWNNDRAQFCEVRTVTLQPQSKLRVDGRENGGVAFYGWNRNEVRVVALVQAQAHDERDAAGLARDIRVLTDGGRVRAEGPSWRDGASWSVSYRIYVPTRSNLEAITQNGGVAAEQVQGEMDFQARNGGISLIDVGGDVRAETTNGGVSASLAGNTWQGRGLDLRTTNGGVSLDIPRGYNARLETGTTNGGMRVDFPITVQGTIGKRITTQLGSGGPLVRVVTTNGGVRVSER